MKNRKLARVLARMARDGETEEVAEILEEILDPAAVSTAPEGGESGPLPGVPAAAPEAPGACSFQGDGEVFLPSEEADP